MDRLAFFFALCSDRAGPAGMEDEQDDMPFVCTVAGCGMVSIKVN